VTRKSFAKKINLLRNLNAIMKRNATQKIASINAAISLKRTELDKKITSIRTGLAQNIKTLVAQKRDINAKHVSVIKNKLQAYHVEKNIAVKRNNFHEAKQITAD
jgi:hypothetical protein